MFHTELAFLRCGEIVVKTLRVIAVLFKMVQVCLKLIHLCLGQCLLGCITYSKMHDITLFVWYSMLSIATHLIVIDFFIDPCD